MKRLLYLLFFIIPCVNVDAQDTITSESYDMPIVDSIGVDSTYIDSLNIDTLLLPRHAFILDDMPNVLVCQDSAILRLVEGRSYVHLHEQMLVDGFRVQVYASNKPIVAKNEAHTLYEQLLQQVTQPVYVISEPPFWKVRLGNFYTRDEAQEYKLLINQLYPELRGSTYVVPDKVYEQD
jgi:hypothetical protein